MRPGTMLALSLSTVLGGCSGVLKPKVIEVPVFQPAPPMQLPAWPPECFQRATDPPPINAVAPKNEREALGILGAENDALRTHATLEARGKNVCVDAHVAAAKGGQ